MRQHQQTPVWTCTIPDPKAPPSAGQDKSHPSPVPAQCLQESSPGSHPLPKPAQALLWLHRAVQVNVLLPCRNNLDFSTFIPGILILALCCSCVCFSQGPSDTAIPSNSCCYLKICTGGLQEGTRTVVRFVQDLNWDGIDEVISVNTVSSNKQLLSKKAQLYWQIYKQAVLKSFLFGPKTGQWKRKHLNYTHQELSLNLSSVAPWLYQ